VGRVRPSRDASSLTVTRAFAQLLERGDVPRSQRRGRLRGRAVLPAPHPPGNAREQLHQPQAQRGVPRTARFLRPDPSLDAPGGIYIVPLSKRLVVQTNVIRETSWHGGTSDRIRSAGDADGRSAGRILDPGRVQGPRSACGARACGAWPRSRAASARSPGPVPSPRTVRLSGTITVAAASVDTKNAKRDTHLRSAEFFDAEAHPQITVRVEGLAPASEGVTVTGHPHRPGPHPPPHLRRHGVHPRHRRDRARRRDPGQPVGLRHDLEPDAHGLHGQHDHDPRRLHHTLPALPAGQCTDRYRPRSAGLASTIRRSPAVSR